MIKKGYKQTYEHKKKRLKAASLSLKGRKCPWVVISNKKRKGILKHKQRCNLICNMCYKKFNVMKCEINRKFCNIHCYFIYKGIHNEKKGKTYEEIYGIEKSIIIKNKIGKSSLGRKIPSVSSSNMKRCGEKSSTWRGGLSFIPYTKEFNKKFKNIIIRRDNYVCMKCGKIQEKNGKKLSVHHINYDKKLTIKKNCCALCKKCNSEVNFNREYWIKFFQFLLTKKYGYK